MSIKDILKPAERPRRLGDETGAAALVRRGRAESNRGTPSPGTAAGPPLPPLLGGARRTLFLRLAALGLCQAASGFGVIFAVGALHGDAVPVGPVVALVGVAIALVVLRTLETVESERLAQDYVAEVRLLLLAGRDQTGQGVSMSRLLNDLSALRNWVGLGAARLLIAPIGIAGCLGAAAMVSTAHMVVVAAPLALVALLALWPLRRLFGHVRDVRRARGRLANRLAEAILANGRRPARIEARVERAAGDLRHRLVSRAGPLGVLRSLPTLVMPLAVATAALLGLPLSGGAIGTILIAGLAADTLRQTLRAAEYRVGFLVARDRLAPGLVPHGRGAIGMGPP